MTDGPRRAAARPRYDNLAAMTAFSPVIVVAIIALASGAVFIGGHRPPSPSAHGVSTQISIGTSGVSLHLIIR